jgi:predicted nucleic acid-binding protein
MYPAGAPAIPLPHGWSARHVRLLYMVDTDEPEKQAAAIALFRSCIDSGTVLLSTQVLQEFYVTVKRKLARPLGSASALEASMRLAVLPLVTVTADMIAAAAQLAERERISFWDALIVRTAAAGGAEVLYTEDLSHGSMVDGVRVVNPFV